VCFCPLDDNLKDHARWPAKILDFLAAGRATVTNDIGEAGSLFRQHPIGMLSQPGDEAFAESINSLLMDQSLRNYYAINARRLMEEEWDFRVLGKSIVKFIEG
jgi:glycosyltransferase involved in cell wall biosynthesis